MPTRKIMVVAPPLYREALASHLEARGDEVFAATGDDWVALAAELSPDVVVVDLNLGSDGAGLVRALAVLRPAPRTVVIGGRVGADRLEDVVDAGVDACVSVDDGTAELLAALEETGAGRRYIGPMIADALVRRQNGPAPAAVPPTRLTGRERQVLALIAQGKTEREIAGELGLSPKTVHTYRTSIMAKFRVHNVIALVRRALDLGLVQGLAIALLTAAGPPGA
jgi:DNA-binding NarL/FixJ family response regulator